MLNKWHTYDSIEKSAVRFGDNYFMLIRQDFDRECFFLNVYVESTNWKRCFCYSTFEEAKATGDELVELFERGELMP